ncbi:MAG: hypothetical protein KIT14_20920 [bacterium]|nr:hypothetical protein [bacterium]
MTRAILLFAAALAAAPLSAAVACERVGSQLKCDWSGLPVTLGTQTDANANVETRAQGFAGAIPRKQIDQSGLFVQRWTNDPSTCKRWGNETYCY